MRLLKSLLILSLLSGVTAMSESVPGEFRIVSFKKFDEEFGPQTTLRVYDGKKQYSIKQLRGWSSHQDPEKEAVVFNSPTREIVITVRLNDVAATPAVVVPPVVPASTNTVAAPTPPDPLDALRARVLNQYPGAKIVDEYACGSRELSGHAFALMRPSAAGRTVFASVAYLQIEGGEFEVTLGTAGFQRTGESDLLRFVNTLEVVR
jgi:hypothetical protein